MASLVAVEAAGAEPFDKKLAKALEKAFPLCQDCSQLNDYNEHFHEGWIFIFILDKILNQNQVAGTRNG